ncbi:MAG: DUF6531 domain-containing protein [Pseudomonadota bacterium]|nr:DUF6531 domain-containing protein [Pseudomonadota bacterium]
MINVATGALHFSREDIVIPGKVDLVWERYYSSALREQPPTALGIGWRINYFVTLTQKGNQFEFITPTGEQEHFTEQPSHPLASGHTLRNLGSFLELTQQGQQYIVTEWHVDTGEIWRYRFNVAAPGSPWPLSSLEDVSGQGLDLFYDTNGRLTQVRQRLEQRSLSIQYNALDRISTLAILTPGAPTEILASYDYDDQGHLTAAYDARLNADYYSYDAQHHLTREHRKCGGTFSYQFDDQHRCIHSSGENQYDEKQLEFLTDIHCTRVTDSRGMTTQYYWLPSGQVVSEVDPLGRIKQTHYDEHERIIAETAPNSGQTRYAFDEWGNRAKITDPLGHSVTLTYNSAHLPLSLTDPTGKVWKREYQHNRLTATEDPLGTRWQFSYDNAGNLIQIIDPNGAQKNQTFSETGILIAATDWNGNTTHYRTDSLGRIIERRDPLDAVTRFEYDPLGNPLTITFADNTRITCRYDADSNLTQLTDANNHTTTWEYTTCGRLLKKTNPLGHSVHYQWGTEPDVLEAIINEKGEPYRFVYNEAEQVIQEIGFDGRQLSFEYDNAGQWIATVNGIGEKITYTRDLLGRLLEKHLPDGSRSQFHYDHFGNLIAAINETCAVRFERDALGRVIRESQDDYRIEHEYNLAGELIKTTTSLGACVHYQYDGNSALTQLTINDHEPIQLQRDARGQEINRLLPGGIQLSQQYDPVGQLIVQHVDTTKRQFALPKSWKDLGKKRPQSPNIRRHYRYDNASNLVEIQDGHWGITRYRYDAAERLIQVLREQGAE